MEKFIGFLIFGSPFILLVVAYILHCSDTPLFRMKCKHCGKKDRNWSTVPIGHDDFAWTHNCED